MKVVGLEILENVFLYIRKDPCCVEKWNPCFIESPSRYDERFRRLKNLHEPQISKVRRFHILGPSGVIIDLEEMVKLCFLKN